MTFSFWVRGDVPSSISFWLADWPYSGNFAAGNGCSVTTTWQRCTVSGTFPSNANGGFYVPFRSDNQGSPIKIYVWGPQLNEGAAGPYVSTAGTARTASGGVATGSVSTLAVGYERQRGNLCGDYGDGNKSNTSGDAHLQPDHYYVWGNAFNVHVERYEWSHRHQRLVDQWALDNYLKP
jgi:hypothetical protein